VARDLQQRRREVSGKACRQRRGDRHRATRPAGGRDPYQCECRSRSGSPALLILLANWSVRTWRCHQPRECGRPRRRSGLVHQPIADPQNVDRRCGRDVLQVGLGLPDVTRAPQPASPHPLRDRPLDPRPPALLPLKLLGLLPQPRGRNATSCSCGRTVMVRRCARGHRLWLAHAWQSFLEVSVRYGDVLQGRVRWELSHPRGSPTDAPSQPSCQEARSILA
jgi:hypothetical protein